jgi:carbon dioxide concentrating mechanism protein CcmM
VGDHLTIKDDAILFRSTVGDHVTIGPEAIVVGVTLADGAQVPAGAVITTQEQADALQRLDCSQASDPARMRGCLSNIT